MKKNININLFLILFCITVFGGIGCKKESIQVSPLAYFRIVNVVTGGGSARLNNFASTIANNPATVSPLTAGSSFFFQPGKPDIYVWPMTDSLSPYYNANKSVTVEANESFLLVVGGTPTLPESLLLKETWQNYTDSVTGIRFINMSPNSTPVNVTLSSSTSVNEFANIAYKGVTDFKLYPATSSKSSYTLQVRRASSPTTVLGSIAISVASGTSAIPRFKNVTIIFRGNIGGTGTLAPGITRVNHY